ncbi:chloride channel protein [Acetivibrio ethanolgignens]|uniref:Chloride channel protein n=1 Tax=Acetivibrio ethanolgignens TaxID=290052 RepID=A0A0V8QIE0_9FIRM|nr:chloride channel protein [Acetivibrio ethanolgignens]KSV60379.1 chloride channel protein [Acetivibrio ethanolgignens]
MTKDEIRRRLASSWIYVKTLFQWIFFAIVVGGIGGAVGTLFHYCIEWVTEYRIAHDFILWLLPVGGIAIVFLYRLCHMENDRGTNLIISSIRSNEQVSILMAPLIFISTVITHLFGGSAGREGAALQIGGSIGAFIGRHFHMDEKNMHLITMCGMSSVFAALFGTPLTAAMFSMEVVSVGVVYYSAIVPCIFSSLVGFAVAGMAGIAPTAFNIEELIPELSVLSVAQVSVLAALCAVLSIVFCVLLHTSGHWFKEKFSNQYIRIIVGGIFLIALTLLSGSRDYNGAGMAVIEQALRGQAVPWAFFLKMLFTAVTIGSGFKGGEIVPTFFVGATFGCVAAPLLGMDAGFGGAVGLIALFCGVVNCPISSLLLSIDMFGSEGMLFFAIASGISYMLSGYYSLYNSQKIVYSKVAAEYVNMDTK